MGHFSEEDLASMPPELAEALRKSQEHETKVVRETKEILGDPTIHIDGHVFVEDRLNIPRDPAQRIRNRIPLFRYTDGKGNFFYILDPKDVSQKDLTDLRDRIIEQRTAWNSLPEEQKTPIKDSFDPIKPNPQNVLPYQDLLRSQALGRIFEGK